MNKHQENHQTILLTGATGFIGSRLSDILIDRGDELAVISREPAKVRSRWPRVRLVSDWSPASGVHPVTMIEQADVVIHLAGENIAGYWNAAKRRAIRESRIRTTQTLVAGMVQAKTRPRLLVAASAVGYYGDRGEESLTEDSPPGEGFLAQVCQDWEAEASHAMEYGIRVVTLRIGLVLDRSGGILRKLSLLFRLRLGGTLGDGRQWMSWIHLSDLIGLILHILDHETISGPVNATAPAPVRNSEFTETLGDLLGRPTPLTIPKAALQFLAGDFADVLLASQCVLPVRAQASGYTFQYPGLEPAFRACLE